MAGFPVFIDTCAPVVIPQPSPSGLFFKADDLRDWFSIFCSCLKGTQLCEARRSGAYDCDSFFDIGSSYPVVYTFDYSSFFDFGYILVPFVDPIIPI